jgi:hypothetical protein
VANTIENLRGTGVSKLDQLQLTAGLQRTYLLQEDTTKFPIDLGSAKVWDSGQPLPSTAASDDLGYVAGTFGTANNYIAGRDCKTSGGAITGYARLFVVIPENYVAGQPVTLRAAAGMLTTVSDTTATIDFEAYLVGRTTLKSGSDLVTTAATTINSLTFADKDFSLTATALSPGDVLDVRVTLAVNDGATGTVVRPAIAAIDLLCSVKG